MKPFKVKAIVLRRTNYGEADRIINLLTPDRGKISAIAKGVRKPKSKLAGGLELLAICEVTLIEGRGSMARVTSARLEKFFGNILGNYNRLELAYSFIKKIARAAETAQAPEFFNLLASSLQSLNDLSIDPRLTELCFNLQIGAYFGNAFNLAIDRDGQKLSADKKYNYDSSENVFYETARGVFTERHIKLLRLAAVKNPDVLARVSGLDGILDDCLALSRAVDL